MGVPIFSSTQFAGAGSTTPALAGRRLIASPYKPKYHMIHKTVFKAFAQLHQYHGDEQANQILDYQVTANRHNLDHGRRPRTQWCWETFDYCPQGAPHPRSWQHPARRKDYHRHL